MSRMTKAPSAFRTALLVGWAVLGAGGLFYARWKGIPNWAALPVLAAFLILYPFYLLPAFPVVRDRLCGKSLLGYLLSGAVLPYLACCAGAVQFDWGSLLRLAALTVVFALWYVVLPVNIGVDLAFLALIPAVLLGNYFGPIYRPLYPGFKDIVFLGHITLLVLSITVLLVERRVYAPDYGFLPNGREWRIGITHFLYFLLFGLPLGLALGAMSFGKPAPLWQIAGMFFGFLWTVALSEEFFFWGVLRQWMEDWTWGRYTAWLCTACAFGLVHIGFRGQFPNWKWVLLAGILGFFCGRARNRANSIKAGMVTHALVFATWRGFFA
jgi:membrane protease YdiL (CAAX protease family)